MLKKRKLGAQGLEVSELGLGCLGMSASYGSPDDAESIRTIHRAIELGVTFFDTAESYGPYVNEELLGRAIAGKRDGLVLATKFGWDIRDGRITGTDSRPAHIRQVAEACLQRLGTDRIDLFYQHRIDPHIPVEEVAQAVGELVKAGKVRFFGVSEAGVENIRRAHRVHPVTALQSEYSLWERNLENEILPVLRELGIGLVPFAPLGRGFLTGVVKRAEEYPPTDWRHDDPRFMGENYDANVRAAEAVRAVAARRQATPAQVCLAWLLRKGNDIVPIPGTKRREFLEENVAAASIVLSAEEIRELEGAMAHVAGPRYIPERMKYVDR